MKGFLQSTINTFRPARAKYTLITGGHLKLTRDLLENIINDNKANNNSSLINNFFILHKDYQINKDDFYTKHENVQVFNCDMNSSDDFQEFSFFLEKQKFKVKLN